MFNIVIKDDTEYYDAVRSLVMSSQGPNGPLITSQNHPDGLPFDKWAKNIGIKTLKTAQARTNLALQALQAPEGERPRIIMIDELASSHQPSASSPKIPSVPMMRDFARTMRQQHPEFRGRWGCYVANGPHIDYSKFAPAIDELLKADAHIAVELYPRFKDYCGSAQTTAG